MSKFLFLLLLAFYCNAQSGKENYDLIIKLDKTSIKSKIIEIKESSIAYKNFDKPNGPSYNIDKSAVFMILYADGTTESFQVSSRSEKPPTTDSGKPVLPSGNNNAETFEVGFLNDSMNFARKADDVIKAIPILLKNQMSESWKDYKVSIITDYTSSTLPASSYKFDFKDVMINSLSGQATVYLLLKGDTIPDKERKLVLKMVVKDGDGNSIESKNTGKTRMEITLKQIAQPKKKDSVDGYEFLSYVGTNFDIAEGEVKAEHFFFATNIYHPPVKDKNKYGFYFSIYGNRAMKQVDSSKTIIRPFRYDAVNDTSYVAHREAYKMISTRISDNIGTYISMLIPFTKSQNDNLKIFYSPSLEFVWRRTDITQVFRGTGVRDSLLLSGSTPLDLPLYNNETHRTFNEYAFNAGIVGLFLALETNDISFRAHASVGYSSSFYPELRRDPDNLEGEFYTERSHDMFFAGRAWVTDPHTGITLQAEVLNTMEKPRPFFGITLSKAFNFKDLGGIFQPLTSH